jgi:hypothetical protein
MTKAEVLRDLESLCGDPDGIEDNLTEDDKAELLRAIELGRESARTEPLLDNEEVFAMARARTIRP